MTTFIIYTLPKWVHLPHNICGYINNSIYNVSYIKTMYKTILETFISHKNTIIGSRLHFSWLSKNKLIHNFLLYRYKDSDSIHETIFRIKNNVEIAPKCICGNKLKINKTTYLKHCSSKCSNSNPKKIKKSDETKLKRYGDKNYNNPEKNKITNLERYGVTSYTKTKECKEKVKKSNLERFGYEYAMQSPELKSKFENVMFEKYGTAYYASSIDYHERWCKNEDWMKNSREKAYNTMLKNNLFMGCSSKSEKKIFEWLKEKYDNIQFNIKKEKYPFVCDYYIPSLDLFIEYNGHWTHNNHSFNEKDENDLLILKKWKEKALTSIKYKQAIDIWTKRDVNKLKIAKKNNLNYLIIWHYEYNKGKEYVLDKIDKYLKNRLLWQKIESKEYILLK